ncbi:MAG: nitrogen fixation protein NifZ [Magnetococcus sp. WYHC-3]
MLQEPRYDYGQEVRVNRTLRNDGTFYGRRAGERLVRRGETGFVRNVGSFLQDQLIYEVHFVGLDLVIGCREQELQAVELPWVDTRFELRDHVAVLRPLGVQGQVVAPAGARGEVVDVLDEDPERILYHVRLGERVFQVPEHLLERDEHACERSATGCSGCSQSGSC